MVLQVVGLLALQPLQPSAALATGPQAAAVQLQHPACLARPQSNRLGVGSQVCRLHQLWHTDNCRVVLQVVGPLALQPLQPSAALATGHQAEAGQLQHPAC